MTEGRPFASTPEPGTPEHGTPEPGTPEPGTPESGTPVSPPTVPSATASGPLFAAAPARPPLAGWVRPLVVIVVAMIALTVVSTAAVLTVAGPSATLAYGAATPSDAYRTFVDDVQRGDYNAANQMLSSRARRDGDAWDSMYPTRAYGTVTVVIDSSHVYGDTATLDVTLIPTDSGSGAAPVPVAVTVNLVDEGGAWKIDSLGANY